MFLYWVVQQLVVLALCWQHCSSMSCVCVLIVVVWMLLWMFCFVYHTVVVFVGYLLVLVVPNGLMAVVHVVGIAFIVHCWLVMLCVTACRRSVIAVINCCCFGTCCSSTPNYQQEANQARSCKTH
jgi:hypothetical protein